MVDRCTVHTYRFGDAGRLKNNHFYSIHRTKRRHAKTIFINGVRASL